MNNFDVLKYIKFFLKYQQWSTWNNKKKSGKKIWTCTNWFHTQI